MDLGCLWVVISRAWVSIYLAFSLSFPLSNPLFLKSSSLFFSLCLSPFPPEISVIYLISLSIFPSDSCACSLFFYSSLSLFASFSSSLGAARHSRSGLGGVGRWVGWGLTLLFSSLYCSLPSHPLCFSSVLFLFFFSHRLFPSFSFSLSLS